MCQPRELLPLIDRVGFDYAATLKELAGVMTYNQIAEAVGYESRGSITKIIAGGSPFHQHGEAIWALYISTFGRKPPLRVSSGAPQD